jgi:hypothetical protein
MPTIVERIPRARKTQKALRGLGYKFNSSVADLIDNCISANAENIRIYFYRPSDGSEFKLIILDDGDGMDGDKLGEAITYGSEEDYTEGSSLGKFGMGLKTASLAHCNTLTIYSRQRGQNHYNGSGIDTALVDKEDKWLTLDYGHDEAEENLSIFPFDYKLMNTIVTWDEIELINDQYSSKKDKFRQMYEIKLITQLRNHIGLVFHRFISSQNLNTQKVTIHLNDIEILPLDPYCLDEVNTTIIPLDTNERAYTPFETKGSNRAILINAFVLPNKEQFSNPIAWERAKGNKSWNTSQGYYIYRNDRIIRFGGWQGIITMDEHTKYARVGIDIPDIYDDLFRIVVHKARVTFPESLKWHLKQRINPKVVKKAKELYKLKPKEKKKIKNKFRKHEREIGEFAKDEIKSANINISLLDPNNSSTSSVRVTNQRGDFISNRQSDILKHNIKNNMIITTGTIDSDDLWQVISDADQKKFTVVINENHPFCDFVYNSKDKVLTSVIDALFYTLGFSELFTKTEDNEEIFRTIKEQMSITLKKLTKEDLY